MPIGRQVGETMASLKKYADDGESNEMMDSMSTSNADFEKASLIDSHDVSRAHPTAPPSSRLNRITLLLSVSNAISLSIIFFLVTSARTDTKQCHDPTSVFYPPQPKWLPPQIPVIKVLEANDLYARPPDAESARAWDKLLPLGRGQVKIHSDSALPEMHGLNQTLGPEYTAWVTVTHQLHCLYSTKHSFYRLLDRINGKRDEPSGDEWPLEHLNHCWDYLRQGLMCNADVTLEWHKYGEPVGTGWGYEHQCKDWDSIVSWIEDHRMTNDYGIIRGGGERIPLDEAAT